MTQHNSETIDRRRFLRNGTAVGVALAGAVVPASASSREACTTARYEMYGQNFMSQKVFSFYLTVSWCYDRRGEISSVDWTDDTWFANFGPLEVAGGWEYVGVRHAQTNRSGGGAEVSVIGHFKQMSHGGVVVQRAYPSITVTVDSNGEHRAEGGWHNGGDASVGGYGPVER